MIGGPGVVAVIGSLLVTGYMVGLQQAELTGRTAGIVASLLGVAVSAGLVAGARPVAATLAGDGGGPVVVTAALVLTVLLVVSWCGCRHRDGGAR